MLKGQLEKFAAEIRQKATSFHEIKVPVPQAHSMITKLVLVWHEFWPLITIAIGTNLFSFVVILIRVPMLIELRAVEQKIRQAHAEIVFGENLSLQAAGLTLAHIRVALTGVKDLVAELRDLGFDTRGLSGGALITIGQTSNQGDD